MSHERGSCETKQSVACEVAEQGAPRHAAAEHERALTAPAALAPSSPTSLGAMPATAKIALLWQQKRGTARRAPCQRNLPLPSSSFHTMLAFAMAW